MASDVLGAFKILINAKPDEAVDAFQKILDSTKKTTDSFNIFSSAITGLNQGFELIGKAKDLVVGVGETLLSAAQGLKEFTSAGGDYKEQRNQLELMAQSYGLSSEKILQSIKNITDGSISIKDSMDVAAKAINTGLSGPEIEKVLTYSKKFSEALGADFKNMSESMIKAMEKGSGESLEKFGLVVEKGADVKTVLAEIDKELTRFGDTGFNAADKFNAISNSMEEFGLRAGKAINDSKSFGVLISDLKDEVVKFVEGFDYLQVTYFFEATIKSIGAILKFFEVDVSSIFRKTGEALGTSFKSGGDIAKEVFKGLIEASSYLLIVFTEIKDSIISIVQSINMGGWIELIFKTIKLGWEKIFNWFGEGLSIISNKIADYSEFVTGILQNMMSKIPKMAQFLGIDKSTIEDMNIMTFAFREQGKAFQEAFQEGNFSKLFSNMRANLGGVFGDFQEGMSAMNETATKGGFGEWNKSLESMKSNTSDIAQNADKLKEKINGIDFKSGVESTNDLKSSFDLAANSASKIGKAVSESGKEANDLAKKQAEEAKEKAKELLEQFKTVGEVLSKGIAGAFGTVDTLLKGYIDIVRQGFSPGEEFKIKVQLEEERATRQQMIDAFLDVAAKLENIDPEKLLQNMKLVVQVTGDDILDKLFKEAIIRAEAEGVLVAGV